MSDTVNSSIDANEKLKDLKSFAQHYREVAEGTAETPPNPHAAVSVAEMAVILETMASLFGTVGIGVRRNEVGQAMPKKRGWERHG
jgi:hypothetical protein